VRRRPKSARRVAAGRMPPPPRRVRRTSKAKRRLVLFYLLETGLVLLLIAAVTTAFKRYVVESPRFQIKSVVVEGARILDERAILSVAGVTSTDNILFFSTDTVRRRVEQMPYIRRCTVERAYPDRVIVRVWEREPAATLLTNNRAYEVDAHGVVLRELDPMAEHYGPLITNVSGLGVIELGDTIEAEALHEAIRVWDAFSRTRVARETTLSEIAADSPTYLAMYLDETPYEIRWGRTDPARKAQQLDILWEAKDGDLPCDAYLDLRFDDDLICR